VSEHVAEHPDRCKQEQFEASRHRGTSRRKVLIVRTDDTLTDERPDRILHRLDGCKGTELHCFESCLESS
jgi:hypothetical protein